MRPADRRQSGARTHSGRSRPPPRPESPPAARAGREAPSSSSGVFGDSQRGPCGSGSGLEFGPPVVACSRQSSKWLWGVLPSATPPRRPRSRGRGGNFPGGDHAGSRPFHTGRAVGEWIDLLPECETGYSAEDLAPASMSTEPLKLQPSSRMTRGAISLPRTRPVSLRTIRSSP